LNRAIRLFKVAFDFKSKLVFHRVIFSELRVEKRKKSNPKGGGKQGKLEIWA